MNNEELLELQDDHEELYAGSVSDSLSNADSISHNQCTAPPNLRKPASPMNISSSSRHQAYGGGSASVGGDYSQGSPKIVTEEKLKCYDKFRGIPVIIEGPEFS